MRFRQKTRTIDNCTLPTEEERVRLGWWARRLFWLALSWNLSKFRFRNLNYGGLEHDPLPPGEVVSMLLSNRGGKFAKYARPKLDSLKAMHGSPFVLLEGIVRVPRRNIAKAEKYYSDAERNQKKIKVHFRKPDFLANGILYYLRARATYNHRALVDSGRQIARDLRTKPREAEIAERDGSDMPLRFHQSMVDLDFPGFSATEFGETCTYMTYVGLRNWWRDPIFVITVDDIIAAIPGDVRDKTLEHLSRSEYAVVPALGEGNYDVLAQSPHEDLAILCKSETKENSQDIWMLSFDPNRIVKAPDKDGQEAVVELRKAIVSVQSAGKCKRVVVRRGDILILDNLRAMVARREFNPELGENRKLGLVLGNRLRRTWMWFWYNKSQRERPSRWLRQLYGKPYRLR